MKLCNNKRSYICNKSNSYTSTFVRARFRGRARYAYAYDVRPTTSASRSPRRVDHRGGVNLGEERQAVVRAAGAAR